MRLTPSSLRPVPIAIGEQDYVAERLTLGDMGGIAEALANEQREAAGSDQDARNAVEPMTPGQLLPWLLVTARGQAVALWTALRKRNPEITIVQINDLVWDDALVQIVYDLLEVKRRSKPADGEGEQRSDPPVSGPSGGPTSPCAPISTPDSTGGS